MKKLIFVICLALLSFNANARCFDNNFDNNFNQCTITEAINRFQNGNIRFIHYYAGFAQGLAYGEFNKNLEFYSQNDNLFQKCVRISSAQIHKKILEQYLSGDIKGDFDYSTWMAITYIQQWSKCIEEEVKKEKQQNSIDHKK